MRRISSPLSASSGIAVLSTLPIATAVGSSGPGEPGLGALMFSFGGAPFYGSAA
jgi:hypothetical protein